MPGLFRSSGFAPRGGPIGAPELPELPPAGAGAVRWGGRYTGLPHMLRGPSNKTVWGPRVLHSFKAPWSGPIDKLGINPRFNWVDTANGAYSSGEGGKLEAILYAADAQGLPIGYSQAGGTPGGAILGRTPVNGGFGNKNLLVIVPGNFTSNGVQEYDLIPELKNAADAEFGSQRSWIWPVQLPYPSVSEGQRYVWLYNNTDPSGGAVSVEGYIYGQAWVGYGNGLAIGPWYGDDWRMHTRNSNDGAWVDYKGLPGCQMRIGGTWAGNINLWAGGGDLIGGNGSELKVTPSRRWRQVWTQDVAASAVRLVIYPFKWPGTTGHGTLRFRLTRGATTQDLSITAGSIPFCNPWHSSTAYPLEPRVVTIAPAFGLTQGSEHKLDVWCDSGEYRMLGAQDFRNALRSDYRSGFGWPYGHHLEESVNSGASWTNRGSWMIPAGLEHA